MPIRWRVKCERTVSIHSVSCVKSIALYRYPHCRPWRPSWIFLDSATATALLVSLAARLVCRLQPIMNFATQLTYRLHHSEHITDAIVCFYWLRASVAHWRMDNQGPLWERSAMLGIVPSRRSSAELVAPLVKLCKPLVAAFLAIVNPQTCKVLPAMTRVLLLSSFRLHKSDL